ncbi:hypothetical protein D3C78_1165000 [compost metagenome]
MRHQQGEALLLCSLAQGLQIAWCLHVFTDHQAGNLGLSQPLQVLALFVGIRGDADARGHQEVAFAQPLSGIGQLAHMGPAYAALQAGAATEQACAQRWAIDDVLDAERHESFRTAGMGKTCGRSQGWHH